MIKAVIIDDELSSRELLTNMLTNFIKDVEVIGEAVDVSSGIELIKIKKPELVFLDIEMPGGNGFSILNAFREFPFKVIFVTSYNQYAIEAIRYAALDFILKPIDLKELESALKRYQSFQMNQNLNLNFLADTQSNPSSDYDKIVVPGAKENTVLYFKDIVSIQAQGAYVFFYLENNEKRMSTYPLSHYEELLPATQFFRIHKSYIINGSKVVHIDTGRGGKAHLRDGSSLDIAMRRKTAFLRWCNPSQ